MILCSQYGTLKIPRKTTAAYKRLWELAVRMPTLLSVALLLSLIPFLFPGCHMKFHKDHFDKKEEFVAYCRCKLNNMLRFVQYIVGVVKKTNSHNSVSLVRMTMPCSDCLHN